MSNLLHAQQISQLTFPSKINNKVLNIKHFLLLLQLKKLLY